MSKKEIVDALEYRGGYALASIAELEAIIAGYREGKLNKDSIRVFAARAEKSALHAKSKVDLSRIVNCKASEEGIKRLRSGVIARAGDCIDQLPKDDSQGKQRLKAVSRRALRLIARGQLTCTESIVLFMYFSKRITQVKSLKRLEVGERYARFTYGELEELSGLARATISRTVSSLRAKGLLSTVWVVKPNENQFGLLFVDGPALTLIKTAPKNRENPPVNERSLPPSQTINSPVIERSRLIKIYPKREIQRERAAGSSHEKGWDWSRILERARQIKEIFEAQAA